MLQLCKCFLLLQIFLCLSFFQLKQEQLEQAATVKAEITGEVKEWKEETIAKLKKLGYVENEQGRKRWFDVRSSARGEFERAAINMPIQSFGADIIKTAMIKTNAMLKEKKQFKRYETGRTRN